MSISIWLFSLPFMYCLLCLAEWPEINKDIHKHLTFGWHLICFTWPFLSKMSEPGHKLNSIRIVRCSTLSKFCDTNISEIFHCFSNAASHTNSSALLAFVRFWETRTSFNVPTTSIKRYSCAKRVQLAFRTRSRINNSALHVRSSRIHSSPDYVIRTSVERRIHGQLHILRSKTQKNLTFWTLPFFRWYLTNASNAPALCDSIA